MCLTASNQTMGCGKSRHHSPGDSETDLKNSGSYNYNKNSSKHHGGSKNAKKKNLSGEDKNQADRTGDCETAERSPSFRKISNGKTRIKDRDEEIGFQASSSLGIEIAAASSASTEDGPDRSNGATKQQNRNYLLEVPNEISKTTHQRTACKDFKTITTSKGVHITTSQLEFFKMLDEKIEKGYDYQTSNEASEVSSIDEPFKQ
ncbi:unnamed protein product [Candidula unifasciata]|uniref:Uncharacterized protein n=1 Tax=Candidula unifasciata TaxID=100452 RepID=A0A8S3YVN2_9EUPU|nr:unnamed protein product [Candidula unifasciata]